jgi:polar amino acid transport system permease protein
MEFLHYLTLPFLLKGALVTLQVAFGAFVVGLVGGVILAAVQLWRLPVLSLLVRLYAVITRGTPLLLQLLFVYDVLPTVGISLSAVNTAILVLGVNTSTFFSEIIRGSVLSLDRGQVLAAQSLGFSPGQAARRIVAPQATRIALPQLANQSVVLVLSSSLASTISVTELTLRSQELSSSTFQILPVYAASGVMYLVLTSAISAIQLWLERVLDLDREHGVPAWRALPARWARLVRATSGTALATGRAATVTTEAPDGDAGRTHAADGAAAQWSKRLHLAAAGDAMAQMPGAGDAPMISLTGLRKSYRGVPALRGVDLDVRQGEVVAIIGRSGCGKSTLLRAIARLEVVDAGDVLIGGARFGTGASGRLQRGRTLARSRAQVRIGMVFQHFELFRHMTAIQNVLSAPVWVYRKPKAAAREQAAELLTSVGLASHQNKRPHQLSGGQQQRVAIARALAIDPRLMLLDEPTSALDAEMVNEVLIVIRALAASGMTMIIATHELKFASEVADRIVFMDGGQIVEHGPPSQLLVRPSTQQAREFLRLIEHEPLASADTTSSDNGGTEPC